ncbi:MAG TPA: hypothetical protein VKB09_05275 [Thermomicrobiales bacterium]|nr:hypothetical protein [Thermomicrobiales bacterium]
MSRLGARLGVVLAGIAGLSLAIAFAGANAAQTPASPVPADCGTPVSSWGGGIADDVAVDLLNVERTAEGPSTPSATPAVAESDFHAELQLKNIGPTPASIAVAEITLVLCDGREIHAVPDSAHPPLPDGELAAGETRTGWVAFPTGEGDVPARLIVPVSRRGLTGGRVEFPLVDDGAGGAAGADAVGGDAVGEDGADGADATAATGDSEQG